MIFKSLQTWEYKKNLIGYHNSKAATCESPFSYLGAFDSPNILRVKKQQLESEESKLTDIWQKKNNLKNCCQQEGCL